MSLKFGDVRNSPVKQKSTKPSKRRKKKTRTHKGSFSSQLIPRSNGHALDEDNTSWSGYNSSDQINVPLGRKHVNIVTSIMQIHRKLSHQMDRKLPR